MTGSTGIGYPKNLKKSVIAIGNFPGARVNVRLQASWKNATQTSSSSRPVLKTQNLQGANAYGWATEFQSEVQSIMKFKTYIHMYTVDSKFDAFLQKKISCKKCKLHIALFTEHISLNMLSTYPSPLYLAISFSPQKKNQNY